MVCHFLVYHFLASTPSGGTVSTVLLATSDQSVLKLVPLLSVKLFIMARCWSGVAPLYSCLKNLLTSLSSSEPASSSLSQFLGPVLEDVGYAGPLPLSSAVLAGSLQVVNRVCLMTKWGHVRWGSGLLDGAVGLELCPFAWRLLGQT